ncbi:MAG: fumarate hydratase [Chloroflexi bacterium]|nr:fumarate hydratase [Chloroflexota bacterium]
MNAVHVSQKILRRMMYAAITRSAMIVPGDVRARLKQGLDEESSPLARAHLATTLRSIELGEAKKGFACADTGWPLFFVKIGDNVTIEGGFSTLYDISRQVVEQATKRGRLRENMVHPLTREYTGTNTGLYIPKVEVRFDAGLDCLEIIAVTKGGGSEAFGTFYRMLSKEDGLPGIIKFVLDSVKEGTYAGKTCGPNIVGIGIGGTADMSMKLAKEAALLRPVGSHHPDPEIARMETDLFETFRMMDRGPMGTGGSTGVLDVHIEYAMTHEAALPVGVQLECCVARRAVVRYGGNGRIRYSDAPVWNYR